MPSPNPTTRRQYAGAAVATTLNGLITSGAGSFVIVSSAGWPTGAVGNFIVTIDRGLATEERIKCSAQSAGTVTVAASGRGFDSTTAQAHANGATVECTLSAFDADEWNQHTNATSGVHGVAGSVVGTTDIQTLTQKTLTSPAINGGVSDAASTIGGVSGTSLAADRTAWTTYVPTWVAGATPTLTVATGHYKQIGKTVIGQLVCQCSGSSSAASGKWVATLPVAPGGLSITVPSAPLGVAIFVPGAGTATRNMTVNYDGAGTNVHFQLDSAVGAVNTGIAASDILAVQFQYEVP